MSKEDSNKLILEQHESRIKFREKLLNLVTDAMKSDDPILPADIMAELATVQMVVEFYLMESFRKGQEKKELEKKSKPTFDFDIDEMLKDFDKEGN